MSQTPGDTTATAGMPALTQEQIDTWSRQQKDTWWLTTVFRGDMAQVTFRSAPTGTMPTGSLSKIPQCTFGALEPRHPPTILMTGVMCVEVASNASNLLMNIKPSYMLGATQCGQIHAGTSSLCKPLSPFAQASLLAAH